MRRSKSSSNIPILDVGSTKKRSLSSARCSTASTVSKLSRRSSSEFRFTMSSNTNKYLTPQISNEKRPRNLSGSLLKWSGTRSASRSPTRSAVREKTIHQLYNDKKWISEQFHKVSNFIKSSGLFPDETIVNFRKPLSIKVFVNIMDVLLKQIFPNLTLTTLNYKEIITKKLKILNYPGSYSNSVLKTVNTAHVWPQVLGMISWLIDLVLIQIDREKAIFEVEPYFKQKFLLSQKIMDCLMHVYMAYNTLKDTEPIIDEYKNVFQEILNVDEEKFLNLQVDVERKKSYCSQQKCDIQTVKDKILEIDETIGKIENEMSEVQENNSQKKETLTKKIDEMKAEIELKKCAIKDSQQNIEKLESSIKHQVCSSKEMTAMVKKMDALKKELQIEVQKRQHAVKLREEFDMQRDNKRDQLRYAVADWNQQLMKWTIYKSELKQLLLRETRLYEPSFLEEIEQIQKLVFTFNKEMADEKQVVDGQLKDQRLIKETFNTVVPKLEIKSKEEKVINDLKHQVFVVETELKKMHLNVNTKRTTLLQELEALQTQIIKEVAENNKLKREKNVREENLGKYAIKAAKFLVNLDRIVTTTWSTIRKEKYKATDRYIEQLTKKLEILNRFKKEFHI